MAGIVTKGVTIFHTPEGGTPHRSMIFPVSRGDWVTLGDEGQGWVTEVQWVLTDRIVPYCHILLSNVRPRKEAI